MASQTSPYKIAQQIAAGVVGPQVITRTSKTGPPFKRLFFGQELPSGVLHAEMYRDNLQDQVLVRWRVVNDPDIHEMPFEQSDEGVLAVLTAMKLTC